MNQNEAFEAGQIAGLEAALSAENLGRWNIAAEQKVKVAILEAIYWSVKRDSPPGYIGDCDFARVINDALSSEASLRLISIFVGQIQNELCSTNEKLMGE